MDVGDTGDTGDEMAEIVAEFLVETHENLDQLDRDLVDLERLSSSRAQSASAPEQPSRELLSRIFRTIHTIKGTCGFLAFNRLEALAHAGENLLGRLRDQQLATTPRTTAALLQLVDCIRALLHVIERTGGDVDAGVPVGQAIAALDACLEQPEEASATARDSARPTPAAAPARADGTPAADAGEDTGRRGVADTSVRVDVELLDALVQLVGELVLTRNRIRQLVDPTADVELGHATQRLDLVVSELQEGVLQTRMQPIGHVWAKLPRVVRDLAAQLDRQVSLRMSGHDTELDRSLLEALRDPILHLTRNAVDHGIEPPAERVGAGKPPEGTLTVRAFHENGQVVVEVTDDGRGLDPACILAAALRRGLITPGQVTEMAPDEVFDLIFRPGFSTAVEVTQVSGRGVGMDVVRTNIERVGGTVEMSGAQGSGTTCRIRVPLTLAVIPALVVGEGGETYAVPQGNVVELVRLAACDLRRDVVAIAGGPVLRLRGQLLPLLSLSGVLGREGAADDAMTVVVLEADDLRFALAVSEVHDTQEIVVKPLGRQLKPIPMYAGATIMGDGRVALILDVAGLARAEGVTPVTAAAPAPDDVPPEEAGTSLLVLDLGAGRRAAIPLEDVARLEEFPAASVEHSGPTEVVQYRGGILPLVRLAPAIGLSADTAKDVLSVVVHDDGVRRVGIVVDGVLDVVDSSVVASTVGSRFGVLGSTVLQERVTDLVDVRRVVGLAGAGR